MEHIIIANEFSGTDRGRKVLKEVMAYFKNKQEKFTVWKTEYSGHATELTKKAVDAGYKTLFIIGGDGTFNQVINGLDLEDSKDISLALIPAGSGNDFVRNTNLKGSTHQILDYIFNSEPKLVDCCSVNGSKFLNMCGFGLDVELAIRQTRIKKFFKGPFSYIFSLLITLFNIRFYNISYSIDSGETISEKAFLIAMGNGTAYGGGIPITPFAKINDGLLDVCVVRKIPYLSIPRLLLKLLKGTLIEEKKYVNYYKCKSIKIDSDSRLPLNLDGELVLGMPCEFEIIPNAVRIYI